MIEDEDVVKEAISRLIDKTKKLDPSPSSRQDTGTVDSVSDDGA